MKSKFILAAGIYLIAISTIYAQKNVSTKVPMAVKEALKKAYPKASAIYWDKEGIDFEASFKNEKDHLSVVFNNAGQIVETEKELTFSQLPINVQEALKGKKVKETAIITKNGKTIYEAEVGGKDLMFDEQGKPIK
jgi:uncharacterized membrane protein YkoI